MARPQRDMTQIYQHLADGWPPKEIAASLGIGTDALGACLKRHRRRIKARTQEHALAMLIAQGVVIARG